MVRRARSISTIIGKLASGNGAQRFPAQLRAVDVEGIRPRGNPKMLNQFVKDVLPRIKYHNEDVAFNVSYAPRKGTEKQKGVRPPPSETDDAQSKQEVKQRLLLHFVDHASKEMDLRGKPASELAQQIFHLAEDAVKPTEEKEAYRPRHV